MSVKAFTITGLLSFGCSLIASVFGGWTQAMASLITLMVLDYITGLIVAGIFHKSNKTDSGSLSSIVGLKGIAKKVLVLVLVAVAYQIDLLLSTTILKDGVCIALCVNEIVSILENIGLMGIKYPSILEKALDILKAKSENDTIGKSD